MDEKKFPDLNQVQKDIILSLIEDAIEGVFGCFKDSAKQQAKAVTYVCFATDPDISKQEFDSKMEEVINDAKKNDKEKLFYYEDFVNNLKRIYGWNHEDADTFKLLKLDQGCDLTYLKSFISYETVGIDSLLSFDNDSGLPILEAEKTDLLSHWMQQAKEIIYNYTLKELKKLPPEIINSALEQVDESEKSLKKSTEQIRKRSSSFSEAESTRSESYISGAKQL